MGTAGRTGLRIYGALLLAFSASIAQAEWLPVTAEELAMKAEPNAPRASAVYLYRQVDRDDNTARVKIYNRIKIFSEEGRDQANIKIPYDKRRERINDIEARTIRPDGSIVEYDGEPFDQTLAKGQGVNVSAKLVTLTDVQVGSIIEYRYTVLLDRGYVFDSSWVLNQDLFTRRAKFSLAQNDYFALRWSWPLGLPAGTSPPEKVHGKIVLETQNVPAFVEEEYMPPDSVVKMRVEFVYADSSLNEKEPDKFWQHYGKNLYKRTKDFIGESSTIRKAAAAAVAATDSDETKARKLYTLVQKLRNTSFERRQTAVEAKREDLKDNLDADDVLKHGYGSGDDLTLLYVAMARAAGLEAYPVLVATRDYNFFQATLMNPNQLRTHVVQLKLDGKDVYVDPGVALAPFGLLPWDETGTTGLLAERDGGKWVNTPMPVAQQSTIDRDATLQMDASGTLTGKLRVTFRGFAALSLRLNSRFDDNTERQKTLENLVKSYIPTGVDLRLVNEPDWTSSTPTLTAEFDLTMPGWMQAAGSRGLFTAALFGSEIKHDFDHATRQHPVYFSYPFTFKDDVTIALPPEWRVGTLPSLQNQNLNNLAYSLWVDEEAGGLRMHRNFTQNNVLVNAKAYGALRDFYQQARAGDEQQIVLSRVSSAAKKN